MPTHGTSTCYSSGCRRPECREAYRLYQRQYRALANERAHRPGTRIVAEEAWMAHAACAGADPELFFPARGANGSEAKAICDDCPVRLSCLAYAVANRELDGIWGATSARQRRSMRRNRVAS